MELVGLLDNNKNKGNKKMSATRSNPQVVTVSDPTVARQLARTVAQEQATGSTNPVVVTNTETLFNQATASAANAAPGQTSTLTVTSSPANDVGDVVTVYRTTGGITVTAVNETVNQYTSVDSGVSQILAGTGVIITSTGASGTGVVTVSSNTAFGNIVSVNLNGNVNSVLRGDGTWGADANSSYGNSNVVSLLASFGSNTITTTGNVSVGNISATNLGNIAATNYDGNAANVLHGDGTWSADITDYGNSNVANYLPTYTGNISSGNAALGNLITANYANIAFDVNANVVNANFLYGDGSNITNLPVGNIATINLDGNASNALLGDGTFGPVEVTGSSIANGSSNITIPAANGNVTINAGSGQWLFDTAGRIEFPGGSSELVSAANYFGLWANGVANTDGIEFQSNGNAFLSTNGSFQIDTNLANGIYSFIFTNTGNLIFPDTSVQDTAWTGTVDVANVSNIGNIATVNLDGSNSNVLYGNGAFAAAPAAAAAGNTGEIQFNNSGAFASTANLTFVDGVSGGTLEIGPPGAMQLDGNGTIVANSLESASDVYIYAANGIVDLRATGNIVLKSDNANYEWVFGDDGILNLAGGGSLIQSIANSSLDPTLPNVSTMVLTPDSNYGSQILVLDPTAPGHIHLRAYCFSNIDDPAANIFLGGEDTSFEITSGSNNQALIHSNSHTWTFGNDSVLTIPGNLVASGASPAPTLSGFSSLTAVDSITVGNANIYSNGHFAANTASFSGNVSGNVALFNDLNLNNLGTNAFLYTNSNRDVYDTQFGYDSANDTMSGGNISLTGTISATNIGNISGVNLDGNVSNVLTGNGTFVALPVINANTVVWSTAPVANTSNGSAGQAAYDSGGNLYVCVATDTWAKFTGTTSW
jgi:hypothetical protein